MHVFLTPQHTGKTKSGERKERENAPVSIQERTRFLRGCPERAGGEQTGDWGSLPALEEAGNGGRTVLFRAARLRPGDSMPANKTRRRRGKPSCRPGSRAPAIPFTPKRHSRRPRRKPEALPYLMRISGGQAKGRAGRDAFPQASPRVMSRFAEAGRAPHPASPSDGKPPACPYSAVPLEGTNRPDISTPSCRSSLIFLSMPPA